MFFEQIGTTDDARRENLIPLTTWLLQHDMDWLKKELHRIGSNETRKAMIVRRNGAFALFVNDMTGKYEKYEEDKDIDIDD